MRDLAEQYLRRPLYLLLYLVGQGEFIDGYWRARGMHPPALWEVLSSVLLSFTAFVWFCRDSDAHRYRRSRLRNIAFIFFGLLFIPYYMVRSREPGQKWRALRRLAGFCFLALTAAITGVLLISLLMAVA